MEGAEEFMGRPSDIFLMVMMGASVPVRLFSWTCRVGQLLLLLLPENVTMNEAVFPETEWLTSAANPGYRRAFLRLASNPNGLAPQLTEIGEFPSLNTTVPNMDVPVTSILCTSVDLATPNSTYEPPELWADTRTSVS